MYLVYWYHLKLYWNSRYYSTDSDTGVCFYGDDVTCAFPCRCTDGCDSQTGSCMNQGQCDIDDTLTRSTGVGCRTGESLSKSSQKNMHHKYFLLLRRFIGRRYILIKAVHQQ